MSLVCAQCSRVNPEEAAYCYHDGAALAGRSGGPINAGSAPFPNQFVFPNGTACRNFDQLALACQEHWAPAIDLLKQGFLGSFFGGMGRVDLAMAAQEAAKFPDIDRGLDQLLAKLPTQSLQPPKLQAEPSEINLGQVKIGQERTTELHLTNLGMRLLYGNVTSDCKWLTFGEAPGHSEKIFQFGADTVLPVTVRGQHLRAGSKPIEGHLVIDSNGGTITVTVKADVPIAPFPGGLFDGATTPRKIAEKAKANPKDAAKFFEGGDVAKWYASNGWAYPVQGPIMSGMASIQQFFEALGVAKAPKIEFSVKELSLNGGVGETVQTKIEVTTGEKKVVYGWATCDQSWVEIGKTKITGKVAVIPITIKVPSPAPPTMEAKLNLFGNGNQKSVVNLKVTVAGGKKGVKLETPEEPAAVQAVEDMVMVVDEPMVMEVADKPKPPAYTPPPPSAPAPSVPDVEPVDDNPFAITDSGPGRPVVSTTTAPSKPAAPLEKEPAGGRSIILTLLLMFIPVALLGLSVIVLIVLDFVYAKPLSQIEGGGANDPSEVGLVDKRPHIRVQFDEGLQDKNYTDSMNFAVHKVDPDDAKARGVKLNWYENGMGNSTVARVDAKEYIFGFAAVGKWVAGKDGKDAAKNVGKYGGRERTFEYTKEGVFVTQTVTIEPGDPVAVGADFVRPLTVCLARYKLHNKDKRPHKVGLRVLLDTCIGENDGVPFTLPGLNQLIVEPKNLVGADVPAFAQFLEKPDLRDPGIIVQLTMRLSDKIEPPSRFLLTRYPRDAGKFVKKWDVPIVPFIDKDGGGKEVGGDSCVVMYWEEKEMKPGETRDLGFTYGIGNITVAKNLLGLTVGGETHLKGELTVVALVSDPDAKSVTLKLPRGLELIDPKSLTQSITTPPRPDKDGYRPVPYTWRVRSVESGPHTIEASTDKGTSQSRRVTITKKSLFN